MDDDVLKKLAENITMLVPESAISSEALKSLVKKYGSTALSAGSPNPGIAALCEAVDLINRLKAGGSRY
jgi:hypothetical protein